LDGTRVEILYFAEAARRAGTPREELPAHAFTTLGELQDELFRRHRRLQEMAAHLAWAVDDELADPSTPMAGARRVAVLPPFSGG